MQFFLRSCFFIGAILQASLGDAQTLLLPEQAVQQALEANFNVRLAELNRQIANQNQIRGNAGLMPNVGLTVGAGGTMINSYQEFANGANQNVNWAQNLNQNANLSATWTVYSGGVNMNTYRLLGTTLQLNELALRQQMENTIAGVLQTYYDLVQRQKTLGVLQANLLISTRRVNIARERYELGSFSKLDYLRAQVDRNADSAAVITQKQSIAQAKIQLNLLLNRTATTDFGVVDTIPNAPLEIEALKQQARTRNTQIQTAQRQKTVAELNRRVAQGSRSPIITLGAGLNASNARNGAGFLTTNRSNGLNYNATLALPLYQGSNIRRQITNAELGVQQADEALKFAQIQAEGNLELTLREYERVQSLYALEQVNVEVARQNLKIVLERYQLGAMSAVDFRDVQRIALEAENRLLGLQFQLKSNEITVLRLAGELVR